MVRRRALDEQAPGIEDLEPAVDVLDTDGLGVLEHDQALDAEPGAQAQAQFVVGDACPVLVEKGDRAEGCAVSVDKEIASSHERVDRDSRQPERFRDVFRCAIVFGAPARVEEFLTSFDWRRVAPKDRRLDVIGIDELGPAVRAYDRMRPVVANPRSLRRRWNKRDLRTRHAGRIEIGERRLLPLWRYEHVELPLSASSASSRGGTWNGYAISVPIAGSHSATTRRSSVTAVHAELRAIRSESRARDEPRRAF